MLITEWISGYINSKVWDEITGPVQNVNGAAGEVEEQLSTFIAHYSVYAITCWN